MGELMAQSVCSIDPTVLRRAAQPGLASDPLPQQSPRVSSPLPGLAGSRRSALQFGLVTTRGPLVAGLGLVEFGGGHRPVLRRRAASWADARVGYGALRTREYQSSTTW